MVQSSLASSSRSGIKQAVLYKNLKLADASRTLIVIQADRDQVNVETFIYRTKFLFTLWYLQAKLLFKLIAACMIVGIKFAFWPVEFFLDEFPRQL
jgi:subtilase family serine protease